MGASQVTDPDLTERVAAQYFESPHPDGAPARTRWVDAYPEDRAYWRGVVTTITQLLDADRDRPWPRIGTINAQTLAQLDTHDTQAREAVEQ
jgi:hypothetical protein